MKKHLLILAAACATLPAMAEYKAEFNTDEATAINITEAGEYRVYNELFAQTTVPIVVSSDIADTVFITLEDVNIVPEEDGSALVIGENSVVVVTLGGEDTESILKGKNGCGIEAMGDLVINGTENNLLTCTGSGRSAAIGTTSSSTAAGSITINGGDITAKAGNESAGIGACNQGRLGDITINGGYVKARGEAYSSAIGGSYISKGTATITINGGMVEAQAGYYCKNSSIGKGNGTHSGTVSVVVLGGSIIAKGEKGAMDGVLYKPTNNNDDVVLFTYTLPESPATLVTEGHIGDLKLGVDYGIKDVYTDEESKLYFYLPETAKNAEVVINGVKVQEAGESGGGEDGDGVENTFGDKTNIDIINTVNGLIINNTENNLVSICDLTGKTVMEGVVKDNEPIQLAEGLYIVRVNTVGNFKCIVK